MAILIATELRRAIAAPYEGPEGRLASSHPRPVLLSLAQDDSQRRWRVKAAYPHVRTISHNTFQTLACLSGNCEGAVDIKQR